MTDNAPQEFYTLPVPVEAWKITADNIKNVARWCGGRVKGETVVFAGIRDKSKVLAGSDTNRYAEIGTYIVRVSKGYDVQPANTFEARHRPATRRQAKA